MMGVYERKGNTCPIKYFIRVNELTETEGIMDKELYDYTSLSVSQSVWSQFFAQTPYGCRSERRLNSE